MKQVLSHHLGRIDFLKPPKLRENLNLDLSLGYGGCAIVPALFKGVQHDFFDVIQDMQAQTIIVGFNPGGGPSPFDDNEWQLCAANLKQTAGIVAFLANKGWSKPLMVGPTHTHHGTAFPKGVSRHDSITRWYSVLNGIGVEYDIDIACEPLNPSEELSGSVNPFDEVHLACTMHERLKIHWDTGHAHSRGKNWNDAKDALPYIAFLELANVGRWPIGVERGINFSGYFGLIKDQPNLQFLLGVEPFCHKVIKTFKLTDLCDTPHDGPEALALDAETLKSVGLM